MKSQLLSIERLLWLGSRMHIRSSALSPASPCQLRDDGPNHRAIRRMQSSEVNFSCRITSHNFHAASNHRHVSPTRHTTSAVRAVCLEVGDSKLVMLRCGEHKQNTLIEGPFGTSSIFRETTTWLLEYSVLLRARKQSVEEGNLSRLQAL
jgi:hypothetical protein